MWSAERQASADFYGFLGEYLAGLEDVRSSGAGAFVLRRCAEVMRSWLAAIRKAQMRGYALVATSQGLFALGTAFAFALSAMLFKDGTLTIGTVYLIFRYTEMLRQPTEQIRNEVQDLQQADASMSRIEALLATAATPHRRSRRGTAARAAGCGAGRSLVRLCGRIRSASRCQRLPCAGPSAGCGRTHRQWQNDR